MLFFKSSGFFKKYFENKIDEKFHTKLKFTSININFLVVG